MANRIARWRWTATLTAGVGLLVIVLREMFIAGLRLGFPFLAVLFAAGLVAGAASWQFGPRAFQALFGLGLLAGGFAVAFLAIAGLYWQAAAAFVVLIIVLPAPYVLKQVRRAVDLDAPRRRRP